MCISSSCTSSLEAPKTQPFRPNLKRGFPEQNLPRNSDSSKRCKTNTGAHRTNSYILEHRPAPPSTSSWKEFILNPISNADAPSVPTKTQHPTIPWSGRKVHRGVLLTTSSKHETICNTCGLVLAQDTTEYEDLIIKMRRRTCPRCSTASGLAASQPQFVWSCSFLPGIKSAFSNTACLYCNKAFPNNQDWSDRAVHVAQYHQYRACSQNLYSSQEALQQHLMLDHHYTAFDWLQRWVEKSRPGILRGM
jgi:ribosomal protein S27AE